MYQAYKCLRCDHIFDMTREARKTCCKAGRYTLSCPICGCLGLEELDLGLYCAGCINPETGRFLSCVDCTFEPLKYNCNAHQERYGKYHILTMYINKTVYGIESRGVGKSMTTTEDYEKLVEKRKAILAEMKITEERLQELTTEMMYCSLQIKKVREEMTEGEK